MGNYIQEDDILRFIHTKSPEIIVKAPSRINLINPLDAIEGDYWAPAMASSAIKNPLAAYCYIKTLSSEKKSKIIFFDYSKSQDSSHKEGIEFIILKTDEFDLNNLLDSTNLDESQKNDIFTGSLAYIFTQISEFKNSLSNKSIEIGILTTIPRQSGIGGSTSLIISILWAIGCYCQYDEKLPEFFSYIPFNKDVISELTTEIENHVLNNPAGYGDRYTIARGGIGFTSYVGKLHQPLFGKGPLAVYDRIDKTYNIKEIPLILAHSGVLHNSGSVHRVLRKKYLEGDVVLHGLFKELSEISWKSRFSFMKHNWEKLGKYFDENAKISEKIMTHAGFKFGIGWANKILIDLINDLPEVYAVKLSGAGGGGSVFALVNTHSKSKITKIWRQKLEDLLKTPEKIQKIYPDLSLNEIFQLKNANFYEITINPYGVQKLKL
ncbi:MAG: hypothetical protein GY870_03515 [archaeon]|nr:hypothetical protein [archaeon]